MMRRGAGFNADQAGWQLLKECQHVTPLELTTDDDIALRIDPVNLKDRLRNVETECRDRLHVWLLRIVGALTAPTYVALTCRWRSRPQHQKRPFSYREHRRVARQVTTYSAAVRNRRRSASPGITGCRIP